MTSRYFFLPAITLLFAACGHVASIKDHAKAEEIAPAAVGAVSSKEMGLLEDVQPAPAVVPVPSKILREATLRFSVTDFNKSREFIRQAVKREKGYIAGETEARSDMQWNTEMTIRIPAAQFDSFLASLAGQARVLDEKTITATDVTEEYVDVAARMKARKEVEQRYLEILKQAKNVKEILEVETQLKSIREEVEAAQGKLQYIDHRADMSTIHLTFYQVFSNTPSQVPGFFERLWLSVKEGWNSLLGLLLGITVSWPLWLFAALFIWGVRRWWLQRSRRLRPQ